MALALRCLILTIVFSCSPSISSSGIYNARSCSNTTGMLHVQQACDNATDGDTVSIPSGDCTWDTNVVVADEKRLTILGQGTSSTIIRGKSFTLGMSGSRLTGIGFVETDTFVSVDGNDFVIDHCSWTTTTWVASIYIASRNVNPPVEPTGVIHSNTFHNGRIVSTGTNYGLNENNAQSRSWLTDLDIGGSSSVYVEGNTFTADTHSDVIDGNYGGRYVFRYNTITNSYVEAHSVQSAINRAIRKWEIYNNSITHSSVDDMFMLLRGGTGVIFNNTHTTSYDPQYIRMDNVRSYAGDVNDNATMAGRCDGNNINDGNLDATGWPCRDQIGRGGDNSLWVYSPPGAYDQISSPAYIWNNKRGETEITVQNVNSSEDYIKSDRDYYITNALFNGTSGVGSGTLSSRPSTCTPLVAYFATDTNTLYKCTSIDTWTTYFTPYTCPHPLTGLTGSCNSSVAGAAGYVNATWTQHGGWR